MMIGLWRRIATMAGATALVGAALISSAGVASAATGTPFGKSTLAGYADGSEIHLGAVTLGTTQLASLDQGLSGASVSSPGGLTSTINAETGTLIQPTQAASVNAYGMGSGLEVGLATPTTPSTDPDQILLSGKAQSTAPPISAPVTKQIGPINLSPIATASALVGQSSAVYDPAACPIGEPISYGAGFAANAQVLSLSSLGTSSLTGPLLNTAGTGTDTAQTHSQTFLQSNGDGTFGLSSQVYETVAPLSVNVLGLLQIQITVAGTSPNQPITMTANAPGGSSGASVTASNLGLLTISLGAAGATPTPLLSIPLSAVGTNGLHIPLSVAGLGNLTSSLTGALSGVVSQVPAAGSLLSGLLTSLSTPLSNLAGSLGQTVSGVANLSLGSIDIDTTPHAIGQAATVPATTTGGTLAAGALDLVHLDLGVAGSLLGLNIPGLNLANLYVGHMEATASLTSGPITCNLPIVKTSSAANVTAGNSFSYTIQIPDPGKLDLISCNLTNITATDTITDNQGTPTFQVTAANDGGTIAQSAPTQATVTWTGLTYNVAPTGQPPNAPITLTINVTIPNSSPSGVIQDVVVASGTAANCNGGISGITNLGGANGVIFGGAFTLPAPSVTGSTGAPLGTGPTGTLPKTGGTGGPWQPLLGLGTLLAGGGALGLARRSRRRSLLS